MPIYDYRCDECGHVFSAVQSYSESQIEKCPSCGKRPRRLISTPAIVFKGGGWYKTDSRGAAPKEAGDGGSAGASGADPKPDKAKADSKAQSKPEGTAPDKTEPKPPPAAAKSEPKS